MTTALLADTHRSTARAGAPPVTRRPSMAFAAAPLVATSGVGGVALGHVIAPLSGQLASCANVFGSFGSYGPADLSGSVTDGPGCSASR